MWRPRGQARGATWIDLNFGTATAAEDDDDAVGLGPEPLSAEALQRSAGRSDDDQLGLRTGWERKTRSKKRNAFLAGGLLGTAAFVAMFVALADEPR